MTFNTQISTTRNMTSRLFIFTENGLSVSDVIHSPGKLNETLVTEFDFDPAVVSAILGARINMSRVSSR